MSIKKPNRIGIGKWPISIENGFRVLIYSVIIIQWFFTRIDTSGDASTYIHMDALRTPGYPIFIKITTLFGLISSFRTTSFIALLLGLFVVHRFCNFLKEKFDLSQLSIIVSTLLLLFYYLFMGMKNTILSETLAYPLFILTVHALLKSLFEKNKKAATMYFVMTALLLLVRPQFVYFYAVSILLIIYLVWYSKNKIKASMSLLGIFILFVVGENLIERSYHLALHKHFEVPSFFGVQFEVLPLYNLQDKDVNLFSDPLERGIIDTVRSYERTDPLFNVGRSNKNATTAEWETFRYAHCYNTLSWRTSEKYFKNYLHRGGLNPDNLDFWTYLNTVTTHIAFTLIKAHPKEYISIYLMNLKSSFNYSPNIYPFLILFFSSIFFFFKTGNNASLLIIIACLLLILNNSLVCFFEPPGGRYSIYTDSLYPTIIFIPLIKFLEGFFF